MTYYHVEFDFGDISHFWWNLSKETLLQKMVVPFVNRQVLRTETDRGGAVINLGTVRYLRVFKTDEALKSDTPGVAPQVLGDPDSTFVKEHDCTGEILDEAQVEVAAPLTRSLLQTALAPTLDQIFVVMKFGDEELDSMYEGVIKPLGGDIGFDVLRIDEVQDSGNITDQVLEAIGSSALIIADLSGERPNTYEAGYAHALGKQIVFTIRQGDEIHFDLVGYRFIQWRTENDLRQKLRRRLEAFRTERGKSV